LTWYVMVFSLYILVCYLNFFVHVWVSSRFVFNFWKVINSFHIHFCCKIWVYFFVFKDMSLCWVVLSIYSLCSNFCVYLCLSLMDTLCVTFERSFK
jgi:hypothetical protein